MVDVTRILGKIESGDQKASEELLPLVYGELRKLAAKKMTQEKQGQTLQATALVHEAYIRLVDVEQAQHWDSPQGWTDGDRDSSGRVQGSLMLLIEFLLSRKELLTHDGGRSNPGPSRECIRSDGCGDEARHPRKMTDRYRDRSSEESDQETGREPQPG